MIRAHRNSRSWNSGRFWRGQSDSSTGLRYVGAAPGAHLINILGCCDGDIEDVMQGAEWAINNKEKYGIDILTSSWRAAIRIASR